MSRRRIGKEPRVLLASTTVSPATKNQFSEWKSETGRNLGGVLDAVAEFSRAQGFPTDAHKKAVAQDSTPAATAPTAQAPHDASAGVTVNSDSNPAPQQSTE